MKKFNFLLIRSLITTALVLIFPYFAQAEMPINQSNLVSQSIMWLHRPNFSKILSPKDCKSHKNVKISSRIYWDKNGDIVKINLIKSSGDKLIDNKMIRELQAAKFYPYLTTNGIPNQKTGVLPIEIVCKFD